MKSDTGFSDKDDAYTIINADPATILNAIKASNYGDHNLVIYACLGQFEEFYIECCKHSILERDEIFILITHYQHASVVRKKLQLTGIETARYENNGSLVILDSEAAYQPTLEENEKYHINRLVNIIPKKATELRKRGITILSDLGTFILKNRIADLISYELSLPVRFDSKVRPFCFYHKDDFEVLQLEKRRKIYSHHSNNFVAT